MSLPSLFAIGFCFITTAVAQKVPARKFLTGFPLSENKALSVGGINCTPYQTEVLRLVLGGATREATRFYKNYHPEFINAKGEKDFDWEQTYKKHASGATGTHIIHNGRYHRGYLHLEKERSRVCNTIPFARFLTDYYPLFWITHADLKPEICLVSPEELRLILAVILPWARAPMGEGGLGIDYLEGKRASEVHSFAKALSDRPEALGKITREYMLSVQAPPRLLQLESKQLNEIAVDHARKNPKRRDVMVLLHLVDQIMADPETVRLLKSFEAMGSIKEMVTIETNKIALTQTDGTELNMLRGWTTALREIEQEIVKGMSNSLRTDARIRNVFVAKFQEAKKLEQFLEHGTNLLAQLELKIDPLTREYKAYQNKMSEAKSALKNAQDVLKDPALTPDLRKEAFARGKDARALLKLVQGKWGKKVNTYESLLEKRDEMKKKIKEIESGIRQGESIQKFAEETATFSDYLSLRRISFSSPVPELTNRSIAEELMLRRKRAQIQERLR